MFSLRESVFAFRILSNDFDLFLCAQTNSRRHSYPGIELSDYSTIVPSLPSCAMLISGCIFETVSATMTLDRLFRRLGHLLRSHKKLL